VNNPENTAFKKTPGGFLIAFEGIDGSGKTTVARAVTSQLIKAGYEAAYLREPTDGPFGRQLREVMLSSQERNPQREFELFLQDRREDVELNIKPLLARGGVACIDRYYISSMAYQGALGLSPQMIQEANEAFAPIPDVILRFVVPIDLALERISGSRPDGANQFEKREYLERVDSEFARMSFPQMIEIDAAESQTDVFGKVWSLIFSELERLSHQI